MERKQRVLIVLSHLCPGGMSQYVINLANAIKNDCVVGVLSTHGKEAMDANLPADIAHFIVNKRYTVFRYVSILKIVNSFHPDIIINNYNISLKYLIPVISKKIRIIDVLHSDDDRFYRVGAINGSRVFGWIAPTQAIAKHFNEYTKGQYSKRVTVIPHGVNIGTLSIKKAESKQFELIFVGMLGRHKGVHILAPIIKQLLEYNYNFHFTIIGKGVDERDVIEPLQPEIAAGIVTLTGNIPNREVYALLNKADILVYPTHCDAFGLVIAEAMMNGVVPVVSLLQGITDNIVDEDEDGYLVEIDNVEGFVTKIRKLMDNPILLSQMALKAHQKAISRFSIHKMSDMYVQYLDRIGIDN